MSAWLEAGGPRSLPGMRYELLAEDGEFLDMYRLSEHDSTLPVPAFPGLVWTLDSTDPATLGAMVGEVRRVWRRPCAHVASPAGTTKWELFDLPGVHLRGSAINTTIQGATEALALAAAYAAAPKAS